MPFRLNIITNFVRGTYLLLLQLVTLAAEHYYLFIILYQVTQFT